jgi:cyclase
MQSPRAEEVSDGVYAYIQPDGSWYINNTGFLAGGGGVISIDACATQQRTRALPAAR